MHLGKRIFSLFLCFVFSAQVAARGDSSVFIPPTKEEKQAVVNLRNHLFKNGGLQQYFINKALKAQLYMPTYHDASVVATRLALVAVDRSTVASVDALVVLVAVDRSTAA